MNRLKHILRPTGFKLGLVMTVLALLVYAAGVPFLHMIELKAFDLHLLSRGKRPPGPVVSIIAIDEKSLDAYGRWPWSR
ncbi:MAG: CHASE2 domain-containing protein, partial [Thermodesulfobacteriota bacterium]